MARSGYRVQLLRMGRGLQSKTYPIHAAPSEMVKIAHRLYTTGEFYEERIYQRVQCGYPPSRTALCIKNNLILSAVGKRCARSRARRLKCHCHADLVRRRRIVDGDLERKLEVGTSGIALWLAGRGVGA